MEHRLFQPEQQIVLYLHFLLQKLFFLTNHKPLLIQYFQYLKILLNHHYWQQQQRY